MSTNPVGIIVFGIPNCDQVRRARAWLRDAGLEHRFHDFRADGLDDATLRRWAGCLGVDALLNRRGTTWRALDEAARAAAATEAGAIALMRTHPALVKRPVVEAPDRLLVGFDADAFATAFAARPAVA